MSGRMYVSILAGLLAIGGTATAQNGNGCENCERCHDCVAAAEGSVVVPLHCDGARSLILGDNLRRGQTTVVDGTAGTQTAGFKVVGDDEDWVKVVGATASLNFDLNPTQGGHIPSSSPGQTTTLSPIPGTFQYWTGTGPNINTATQTATVPGAPHGLDWNESPGNGSRFFYVGASFRPASDQQRGRYEGTVTLDVEYF